MQYFYFAYRPSLETYSDTLTSSSGCDSVITIQLTIHNDSYTQIHDTACGSYTAPDGSVWSSSGTFIDSLQNSTGCDSIVEINYIVTTLDTIISVNGDTLVSLATGTTYQWIDCKTLTPISGANSATFIPSSGGKYAVIVTEGNCTDTSDCYEFIPSSINELQRANCPAIKVVPNPNTGSFQLVSNRSVDVEVQIISPLGRMVYQGTFNGMQKDIQLEELSAGIYFMRTLSSKCSTSVPLVIK